MEKIESTLRAAQGAAQKVVPDIHTNAKVKDLERDVVDVRNTTAKSTSDYGVLCNTDAWLKVVHPDKQNGAGPLLLEDPFGREKIHRFDHERIPERVVHARGTAAHGYFKLLTPIPEYSMAGVLNDTSRTTPTFVRFSTVLGSRGSADTVRDVRGFATKFYTQEGNWDIVGNNIPVFFIQDDIKFPDIIHAGKPEPHNEVPQAQTAHNNFWDFQYLHSEATHMFMWTQSDRAIPRSYRMMQGFGVNTFTLINARGERHFVKFFWTPELGVHSLVWDEALKLAGQDPDFHRKDLYEAIEKGYYPKWKFGIQVIPEGREDDFEFDILDATKLWPENLVPIKYIGEMVLNRNVDEFFPETEQVAFCTSHVVPGIGFSDDPLLQGRNFSYFDTQITRLGVNWQELPINKPICPVMNFNRDGAMKHTIHKGNVNYWPNRHSVVPPATRSEGGYAEYLQKVIGVKMRAQGEKFKDHFSQAQLFYNSLSPIEKKHVHLSFGFELDHCDDPIVYERMCERLCDIDLELAQAVAEMVGGPPPQKQGRPNHGKSSPGLSQMDYLPKIPSIATRKVALIIADGFDYTTFETARKALEVAGAFPLVIGPRRHLIYPGGDKANAVKADHHFEGLRSTMFDALLIIPGRDSIGKLKSNGRCVHWIREAFGHLKTIGALGDAVVLVQEAILPVGINVSTNNKVVESYGVVTQYDFVPEEMSTPKIILSETIFLSTFMYGISNHRCWDRELDGLADKVAF